MSLWLCISDSIRLCVCVLASDGVARGGTGSVVVLRCVWLCVGRVARSEIVVGSAEVLVAV